MRPNVPMPTVAMKRPHQTLVTARPMRGTSPRVWPGTTKGAASCAAAEAEAAA